MHSACLSAITSPPSHTERAQSNTATKHAPLDSSCSVGPCCLLRLVMDISWRCSDRIPASAEAPALGTIAKAIWSGFAFKVDRNGTQVVSNRIRRKEGHQAPVSPVGYQDTFRNCCQPSADIVAHCPVDEGFMQQGDRMAAAVRRSGSAALRHALRRRLVGPADPNAVRHRSKLCERWVVAYLSSSPKPVTE